MNRRMEIEMVIITFKSFMYLTKRITGAYTPDACGETKRRPQDDCANARVYKCPVNPLVRFLRIDAFERVLCAIY